MTVASNKVEEDEIRLRECIELLAIDRLQLGEATEVRPLLMSVI